MQLRTISIEEIELRPGNPRITFATESLKDLEHSLKRDGIIQPIVVRPKGNKYELVVGERRVRAAIGANISKLQVIVREDLTDADADRLRLIENLQRDELSFIERVKGIEAHMQRQGIRTLNDAATDLNLSPDIVKNWFKVAGNISGQILSKDEYVRRLGLQKLAEIVSFEDDVQEKLAEQIYKDDLTVDQVRRFVGLFKGNPDLNKLPFLSQRAQQQVRTVEVTLPIEEIEALEKRAKEFRKLEESASKKVERMRRKPKNSKQIEQDIAAASVSKGFAAEAKTIAVTGFALERLRERELVEEIRKADLSPEERKVLNVLKTQYPQDTGRQLIDRVTDRTRSHPIMLELDPGIYSALTSYGKALVISNEAAAKKLIEEGLEKQGYWKRAITE